MTDLEQFIKDNRGQVIAIIRNSPYKNLIDHMDEEEIIYSGLWECHTKFNPERATLKRFTYLVIESYILRLIKKKLRVKNNESSLEELPESDLLSLSYSPKENPAEYFDDCEWKYISALLENKPKEAAKQRNISFSNYRILLRVAKKIGNKRKEK